MKTETKCLHAGYEPKNGEPREVPIYQSTTFKYDSSLQMGRLFDLEDSGYFYSRLQNPTNDIVASKIKWTSCQLLCGIQHLRSWRSPNCFKCYLWWNIQPIWCNNEENGY